MDYCPKCDRGIEDANNTGGHICYNNSAVQAIPIKDFCLSGTCKKLKQSQAENERLKEIASYTESIQTERDTVLAENKALKLQMQIHAGDICSISNENERFVADKYEAEERADNFQAEIEELKERIVTLERKEMEFDEKNLCSKCGSDLIGTEYRENRNQLMRICQRCGFFWYEEPIQEK